MTIKVNISTHMLKIGDIVAAEELPAKPTNRQMAYFLARFMIDDTTGERVPYEQAKEAIMDVEIEELPRITREIQEAILGVQAAAVPLETSGG